MEAGIGHQLLGHSSSPVLVLSASAFHFNCKSNFSSTQALAAAYLLWASKISMTQAKDMVDHSLHDFLQKVQEQYPATWPSIIMFEQSILKTAPRSVLSATVILDQGEGKEAPLPRSGWVRDWAVHV